MYHTYRIVNMVKVQQKYHWDDMMAKWMIPSRNWGKRRYKIYF